jgi:hypothetical protein
MKYTHSFADIRILLFKSLETLCVKDDGRYGARINAMNLKSVKTKFYLHYM